MTQAANSSCDFRSATETVAGGPGIAGGADVGVGDGGGLAIPPLRALDSRPHSGQTTSRFEPVAWRATWQCGQSVLRPAGVYTGAGARGAVGVERVGINAGVGGGGAGISGRATAHRTVRRDGIVDERGVRAGELVSEELLGLVLAPGERC